MCGSNTLENAAIVGTGGLLAPVFMQKRQIEQQKDAQNKAIERQNAADTKAQEAAEAIGPAAKSTDLTQEASVYGDLKRNKVAMQQGILGTMKTNPLAQTTASTQKTTLGT